LHIGVFVYLASMVVDKKVISELIRRQMAILGSEITMARVKNVPGLEVGSDGEIILLHRDPQAILADLTNQFVELSGLIVKRTMESILASGDELPILQPQIPAAPPVATLADRQVLAAQKEIENLNKILNNVNT